MEGSVDEETALKNKNRMPLKRENSMNKFLETKNTIVEIKNAKESCEGRVD